MHRARAHPGHPHNQGGIMRVFIITLLCTLLTACNLDNLQFTIN
jgi:hypothetical protein